jgi:hypothetical protein
LRNYLEYIELNLRTPDVITEKEVRQALDTAEKILPLELRKLGFPNISLIHPLDLKMPEYDENLREQCRSLIREVEKAHRKIHTYLRSYHRLQMQRMTPEEQAEFEFTFEVRNALRHIARWLIARKIRQDFQP